MPRAFDVHSTPSARQAAVPRRVLLCYDGSAEAKHALERVGEIASVVPSRVTVVSVADPIYSEPPYAGFADSGEEQTHRRLVEKRRATCAAAGSRPQRSKRSATRPSPSSPPPTTTPTSSWSAPDIAD
jgi:hypothetical protein